jgi:hypothetical protein
LLLAAVFANFGFAQSGAAPQEMSAAANPHYCLL